MKKKPISKVPASKTKTGGKETKIKILNKEDVKLISKALVAKPNSNGQGKKMTNAQTDVVELLKGKEHIIVEIVEYVSNAVISRTIIKKITGNVTAMSFSEGEELTEKTIPFDTYIQIIDGAADITIGKKVYHLKLGSGIVIPAHSLHHFNATQKFKMISTIIKSGYED